MAAARDAVKDECRWVVLQDVSSKGKRKAVESFSDRVFAFIGTLLSEIPPPPPYSISTVTIFERQGPNGEERCYFLLFPFGSYPEGQFWGVAFESKPQDPNSAGAFRIVVFWAPAGEDGMDFRELPP